MPPRAPNPKKPEPQGLLGKAVAARPKGTTLTAHVKKLRDAPVWKGPEEDGITFSLLSRFIVCRERFRLMVVDGLKANDGFNQRIEFGNMWHVCEEANAGGKDWDGPLTTYCQKLCQEYRKDPQIAEKVGKWREVIRRQFPIYLDYWSGHKDETGREPVLQEECFKVPIQLPDGRVIYLRGKWDQVDIIKGQVWLKENKTKGDIDPQAMVRQLTFDLQTMIYLVALEAACAGSDPKYVKLWGKKVGGVRYNVIRRPLSGGRHTIKKHEPTKSKPAGETDEEFYERLRVRMDEDRDFFFMRWNVVITAADIERFKTRCLVPLLAQLYHWYQVVVLLSRPYVLEEWALNWQHPFGVYNPLDEGGHSDLDEYLMTGNETGLTRTTNLFPELT